ncbi:MAG: hypothetical protein AAFO75_08865 [Pseudomonadota bacterium]
MAVYPDLAGRLLDDSQRDLTDVIWNFLKSLVAIMGQWAKGVAGLPWRVVQAGLRLTLSILLSILGFIGSIVRPATRFLAFVFLVVATVAFVADITPSLSGVGPFNSTTFAEHWRSIAKVTLQRTEAGAESLQWGVPILLQMVLQTPTYLLFGGLGLLMSLVGRRAHRVNVFTN